MSAFLVSKKHIDALVSMLDKYDLERVAVWLDEKTIENARNAVGTALWSENQISVNTRYSQKEDIPEYFFEPNQLTPLEVIKLCQCLAYQSSEYEGWNNSPAKMIVDLIKDKCICKLEGYETAKWTI